MIFITAFSNIKITGVDSNRETTRSILKLERISTTVDVVGFGENEARQFAEDYVNIQFWMVSVYSRRAFSCFHTSFNII